MAEITAALVKDLRTKTGAGMMDCKKALGETDGDIESAIDWLRKKGLAAAAKKAGRVAAEGLVAVAGNGLAAAVLEVNSETDFVARNPQFQEFVATTANVAVAVGADIAAIAAAPYPGADKTVAEQLTALIATIGENMSLRRAVVLSVAQGAVASYIHSAVVPGLGRIGVLVAISSAGPADKLEALGKQIAMHIAATNPASLDVSSLDQALVQRERDVLTEHARASGKPDNIIEKMIDGRIRKYYEEVVLLEQVFVIDGETRVGKVVETLATELGTPVTVTGFVRFGLGDGIEKEQSDFAAEVAAQAGL